MGPYLELAHAASGDWLVDDGEMGALIRSMDWSQTPLGPRSSWPHSLRTTVNLCLASNFPISIVWGPQRVLIYNDGYWPMCGAKHPFSMGQDFRECWLSAWPVIGEAFDLATSGQAAFLENQRIFLDRIGYLEETFFTISFSPIRDESGAVGGLFNPVIELTQQTLAERRLKVLRTLANSTADAKTVDQAISLTTRTLTDHALDLPFLLVYLLDSELQQARLVGTTGLQAGTAASPEFIDLDASNDLSWPLASMIHSRDSKLVEDLEARIGPVICEPYREPMRQAMMLPIILPGLDRTLAIVVAGVSTRRPLDQFYRTFYDMLGAGITTALSNARAYELERKRAEALVEIDKAKTVFFSNISHEFRTPLTLMLGPLDDLLRVPSGVLETNDRLQVETVHRNALRLLKLVNSLLDFSRIEAGRAQAAYKAIDLAQLTREMAAMFGSAVENAGLQLIVDCPPLPQPVYVDPDMWEKIVLNLVSNAFKFTFAGTITVRLQWHNDSAVLTVSDTGVGVPPEHVPRLFERFHRVANARSRSEEGTGIGLALIHELVKLHGGTISVDSVLNKGTTFTVTIPGGTGHLPAEWLDTRPTLASTAIDPNVYLNEARQWVPGKETLKAPMSPPETHTLPTASSPNEPRARILLADDNADMREYLCRLLAPYWDVEAVPDGMQALEVIRREPPDLVLTDIMMPNLDGFGLLSALRANKCTRTTPVIMLSAQSGEEARVGGLEAGADDYLVKPFGPRELLARVKTHLDIARLRRDAVELAQHDALTGLPNRKLTLEFAEQLLASARRGGKRIGVLFIDMDRFKPINDTHGHEAGDAVLKEIARRLKACVRAEDTVGRLGGDEFVGVLSHVHDSSDAGQAARHIIDLLNQPYYIAGLEVDTSPSIGIALYPDDGADMEQLIRNADIAMYHAKEKGRNNFQFYTQQLNDNAALARRIESQLRSGLEHGEFQLYYQPIVDVSTHALVGVEALMRWPTMGLNPSDFIPVAETSGMINEMGNWTVHEACRQIRQWRDRRLPELLLSINVSPLQLQKNTLYDVIVHALNEHHLEPATLQLEFTEAVVLNNKKEAISSLHALKSLGVKIAFDDFGKSYSNLSYLQLPLDAIKIDQGFVHNIASDPASAAITNAIITIGKTLGLHVVAKGIESDEALTMLRDKDCHEMQGYYLCPPVSAEELEVWYHRWQTSGRFNPPVVH